MAKPTKKRADAITTHDLAAVNPPAVDWSEYTADPHIGADLDCALRKLILCGMDPTDAVQVLGELATDSEKPSVSSALATSLPVDFHCLTTPVLQVKAGASWRALAEGIYCNLTSAVAVINDNAELVKTIEAQSAVNCAQLALEVAAGLAQALVGLADAEARP